MMNGTGLRRKHVIIFVVILLTLSALIAVGAYLNYLSSTFSLTINYDAMKSTNVKVEQFSGAGEAIDIKVMAENIQPAESIRLPKPEDEFPKNYAYRVTYGGKGDFAGGFVEVPKQDKVDITINPTFSEQYYDKIIDQNKEKIISAIKEKYPRITEYELDKGIMMNDGEWYGTRLIYRGDVYENSDVLRIVLKNNNSNWVVMTKPDIILTQKNNPEVPLEILSQTNNYESGLTF